MLKVNYDTGNSGSLGYRPTEEFAAYGSRIGSVHVKDRILGGGSVPLGNGSTDFPTVFEGLRKVDYCGDFTLQAARGQPGDEVKWARKNLKFLRRFWPV
jgi:hexulose-6-phosphate isomerase